MTVYGMPTDEGDARVQEIVEETLALPLERDEFVRVGDRLLTRGEYLVERLDALALDPEFVISLEVVGAALNALPCEECGADWAGFRSREGICGNCGARRKAPR